MADIQEFSDPLSMATRLADQICKLLQEAITQNSRASLAVSGGSTPVTLFDELSNMRINWQQVVITLVDERWVDPEQDDSNEHLVRAHLLKNNAASATFIGMKNEDATAEAGEKECEQRLASVPRPIDVIVLGMGGDGHTASLFPAAEKLSQATDMHSSATCMAITPPEVPHERMTLTLPALLDSRRIFLLLAGQKKYDVLQKALQSGPAEQMPIRFILHQQTTPVTIYWSA